MWCWDPVTVDCQGVPERAPVVYHVEQSLAVVIGFTIGPDGDILPVYAWLTSAALETSATCAPEAWPVGVGQILAARITAIDGARNVSNIGATPAPCP